MSATLIILLCAVAHVSGFSSCPYRNSERTLTPSVLARARHWSSRPPEPHVGS
jgi:hypothetical protein